MYATILEKKIYIITKMLLFWIKSYTEMFKL